MGGNVKEMREEWQPCYGRSVPFSGTTVSGSVAMPRDYDANRWVERPVAKGKYALDHMGGKRYAWDHKPRPCLIDAQAEPPDMTAAAVAALSMGAAAVDQAARPPPPAY